MKNTICSIVALGATLTLNGCKDEEKIVNKAITETHQETQNYLKIHALIEEGQYAQAKLLTAQALDQQKGEYTLLRFGVGETTLPAEKKDPIYTGISEKVKEINRVISPSLYVPPKETAKE